MFKTQKKFLLKRLKSIKFSFKGMLILAKTEANFKIHLCFVILVCFLGFFFKINCNEWIVQLLIIGLVLVTEALNTAIEKIANFIHPDFNKNIGNIKDISAAAPGIAAIISIIIGLIIYTPKILKII